MVKSIIPLYDRLLVKRIESEEKTVGGLFIPDTAKEKTQCGEIIATGLGKLSNDGSCKPLCVKAGDKVIFGKYSGTDVNLDGQEYLILKEDEVLAIINNK